MCVDFLLLFFPPLVAWEFFSTWDLKHCFRVTLWLFLAKDLQGCRVFWGDIRVTNEILMRLYKIACENCNEDVTALQYNKNKREGSLIDRNAITQHCSRTQEMLMGRSMLNWGREHGIAGAFPQPITIIKCVPASFFPTQLLFNRSVVE